MKKKKPGTKRQNGIGEEERREGKRKWERIN
jgi:hypothetical protein